jgi:hypothetical protein
MASIAMLLEGPPDVIPLTIQERARLAELESVVETHLETFLSVGRALAEIRNRRLYREEHPTWELYCTRKWGFGYSRANELIRSTEIAESLLSGPAAPEGDAPLPLDLSPATLRPLQKLDPPLQSACWRLAARMGRPTAHTVGKIVRMVTSAIGTGNGTTPKAKVPQSERKVFVLSLCRLSDNAWFNAHLVAEGLDEARAQKLRLACQTMITRCHEVLEEIRQQFPSL